jgi:hypothetical protein
LHTDLLIDPFFAQCLSHNISVNKFGPLQGHYYLERVAQMGRYWHDFLIPGINK